MQIVHLCLLCLWKCEAPISIGRHSGHYMFRISITVPEHRHGRGLFSGIAERARRERRIAFFNHHAGDRSSGRINYNAGQSAGVERALNHDEFELRIDGQSKHRN